MVTAPGHFYRQAPGPRTAPTFPATPTSACDCGGVPGCDLHTPTALCSWIYPNFLLCLTPGAMGCSSSTQTQSQGGNRPPAKTVETNGPKKSASQVSDQIIDDIETIPDQTKLVPLTENEPSSNGIPPEEEQIEAEEAIEFEGAETAPTIEETAPTVEETALVAEDSDEAYLPVDQEPEHAEEPTDVTGQASSAPEGETEEAIEANKHEEIVSEEPETKEDETEPPADVAEPELDTANVEE